MKSLDDWIDSVRSVMPLVNEPVDVIRIHPDDMRELRELSAPVTGGSFPGFMSPWGIQTYSIDGLRVFEDQDAPRLPRKQE